jgi:hypothetical protein
MSKRTKPSAQCRVCKHPERPRIELLVAGGASHRSVGAKFGLSHYSIGRHWKHTPEERKVALAIGPVGEAALAARVSEESASVLDNLRAVRAGLWHLFDMAVTAGDRSGGSLLAGRLNENLNSVARLTGQIMQSPMIQNTTINLGLRENEQFERLKLEIVRILSNHPAALADVIREFERVEQSSLPALEHHVEREAAETA